jgi:hypothetical protein
MNDYFGISIGVKAMTAGLEARSQFGKVIDLSIKNDPDRSIFVVDWLPAIRKIDDTQPAHSQASTAVNINPFIVRSAMYDRLTHAMDIRCIDCIVIMDTDNACYSAHSLLSPEELI